MITEKLEIKVVIALPKLVDAPGLKIKINVSLAKTFI